MSRRANDFHAPSLAQHFEPPDQFVGHFGWVIGYSADAQFLNDAAERFTRHTAAERAYSGRPALALFLDSRNGYMSPVEVPGVAHCRCNGSKPKACRLIHAKVALLGFRHVESSEWRVRLIVSTGNWTRQTLENSLDLAWCIEVSTTDLVDVNSKIGMACADIKAAFDLLQWVAKLTDDSVLRTGAGTQLSENGRAQDTVVTWIKTCARAAQGAPRFFDNRKWSLLHQLPDKIRACAKPVARNSLAMGSGYFEGGKAGQCPTIPTRIVAHLNEEGLLTKSASVNLYVNEDACQGVAHSVDNLAANGITVRPASQPSALFGNAAARTLHAKFLFSATWREGNAACLSPWIYLGSGNLTLPGFTQKARANAGNLEAGVVFSPAEVYWQSGSGIKPQNVITNLLPVQWDVTCEDSEHRLSFGDADEDEGLICCAPPIGWLQWYESDHGNELRADCEISDVDVLDPMGEPCERTDSGYIWRDTQPRQVWVRWKEDDQNLEALVPVVDQYGRIAATELPDIDLESAMAQLWAFPTVPVADEDPDADPDNDPTSFDLTSTASRITIGLKDHPIRSMMELIESISAKQVTITEADWTAWCTRLEQTLIQAKRDSVGATFRKMELNPFSPLRFAPFRPTFVQSGTVQGTLYEETLSRVEAAWGVQDMRKIGEV